MESRGSGDSDCESPGWTSNVGGEVAEDQIPSDDSEVAASVQIGTSDHSTSQSKPTLEVLDSDSQVRDEAMGERPISGGSDSKVKQRGECVLGVSGGFRVCHSSQVEEPRPAQNSERGGGDSQSSAGGGDPFHDEELPLPSNGIHGNSTAKPGEEGGEGEILNGWQKPSLARSDSAPVQLTAGCRKLPINVLELALRLSESLGLAVATVFHEVFERNERNERDFRRSASPVDELAGLLGAALKESLFLVLGNERGIFVEKFRNSFRSTYQTMRSVSHAFAKSTDKLRTSSRQRNPDSWRASQPKPRRFSPGQSYRGRTRTMVDEKVGLDMTKHAGVGNGGVSKNTAQTNTAESTISEEESTSCTPRRYALQHYQRLHSPCNSVKSCLDESLQSAFFTSSGRNPGAYSDNSESCSNSCLKESLESSFFTSSHPERHGQAGSTKSCSMNSASESLGSLLLVPTPDAKDVQSELVDSEDSWDVDVFSATSSTVGDSSPSALGQSKSERGFAVTFDSWTPKKDHNDSGRLVEYETNPPSRRCVVDSTQDLKPVASSSDAPGRSLRRDSMRHTKPMESSDSLERGVVGDSMQETRPGRASDGPASRNQNSLNPGTLPMILRSVPGSVPVHSSLDRAGDRPVNAQSSQGRGFGASSESGESWGAAGEPSTNSEHTSRGGAGLFGRPSESEPANYENSLVHRRLRWGDNTQLTGPQLEEALLPPFFNYGVRANNRETLLERYVKAQETQNHLKQLELVQSVSHLQLKKDHVQLQSESNVLLREDLNLSRSKIELKEFALEDCKLTAAHLDLSRTCADELVAGLCVMLLALACGAYKFAYSRLSGVVTGCERPPRESRHGGWLGTNWMANAMDTLSWHFQAVACEVTKAGRMLAGLIIITLITVSLLRRTVTSSSQTMPATIIIVVLAGICGFAGKISIDFLGGDGYLWLILWETLCFLHAFATTCTPWLYKYLYGPSSKFYRSSASSWMKLCSLCARFSFHTFLAFVLPVMAGLLPFASLDELNAVFWEFWEADTAMSYY